MHFSTIAAVAGFSALAAATPIHPPTPVSHGYLYPRQNSTNTTAPCAQASVAYFNQVGAFPTIPAQLAYDCIKSIPFNATSAKTVVKEMVPYVNWQSTLSYLKNPPAEYAEKIQPPVDILGGLDKISANIDAGKYANEYEFGWDLYLLLQTAHDGHFTYVPDSVGSIFTFGRKVPLVSVSEDGKKLPSIFAYQDVLGLQFKNISYTPSPVVQIDGQDALKWAENWSQYGSLQDRDALYNNVFYELAQISLGSSGSGTGTFTGGGRGRWVFPGATTTLTFANGTKYTMENYARVLVNMRGIQSGEDLAKEYFYFGTGSTGADPGDGGAVTGASPVGYPGQVVAGPQNLINGYYINAPGYEDVAVLSVPNFVGTNNAEIGFQQTTQKFLPKAVADGKKKLIIDVQANGGGTILQGYDLFKQLFPDKLPYGATRFRAHEAPDLIGQAFSAFDTFPRDANPTNETVINIQSSYFDYRSDASEAYTPFTSWEDKWGPVSYNNDNFSKIARWNLSDPLIQYNSGGINVTGYANRKNFTTQYFKPEDIVILTDGYCASTCTIFAELAKQQANVKTIAMGGRANKNAIQAIGGVKGTNNYQWGFIQELAQNAVEIAPADRKAEYDASVLKKDYYSDTVFARAASAPGSNVRDGIRQGDLTETPLQFVYEAADCRLYYTPEMTVDVTAIWKAAADSMGGKGNCVMSGGYGKREEEATTHLKRRNIDLREKSVNMDSYDLFMETFSLETECALQGDGFMHP